VSRKPKADRQSPDSMPARVMADDLRQTANGAEPADTGLN
jgi:hypothetical protein